MAANRSRAQHAMIREKMLPGGIHTHRARRGEWEVLAHWIAQAYPEPEAQGVAMVILKLLGRADDHEFLSLNLNNAATMAISHAVQACDIGGWEEGPLAPAPREKE